LLYVIVIISIITLSQNLWFRKHKAYLRLYYYHWVNTSSGGILVPEGIIRPVVSASVLTWFIRYIYY